MARCSGRDFGGGSRVCYCALRVGRVCFWTVDTHLLAGVLDALNGANFQRGGGKGKRPEPVPRPDTPTASAEPARDDSSTLFGGTDGFEMDSVSIEEMNEWLGLAPAYIYGMIGGRIAPTKRLATDILQGAGNDQFDQRDMEACSWT